MRSSKVSVEEVVEKIKAAMSLKAESKPVKCDSVQLPAESTSVPADLQKDLDLELYNNNLRWNLVTEQPITSHRKAIGPFLVFGRKLVVKYLRWYINPPLDQQRSFNGSITRSINLLRNIALTLNGQISQIDRRLRDLAAAQNAGIEATNASMAELDKKTDAIHDKIEAMQIESEKSAAQIAQLYADLKKSTSQVNELTAELAKVVDNDKIYASDRQHLTDLLRQLDSRITAALVSSMNMHSASKPLLSNTQDEPGGLDIDYFSFEQKYRGDMADIRNRQQIYLDMFTGKGEIVDIGCGRGEFVELLTERGVSVTGIDLDDKMVRYCVDRGLPVLKVDAFRYLEARGDGSLGGIFMSQVIEHFQPKDVIRFIKLAHTKLKPGGILLIETIDPSNIVAMSTWFQMDLSHTRPLHPLTARFLFESACFEEIRLIPLNPDKEHEIPTLRLDGVSGNLQEFNKSIEYINKVLAGPQDYAIVGTKSGGVVS